MLNWADSIMNSLSQYSLFWSLMTLRSRDKKTVVKNNQVYSSCVLNSQDIYRLHHNLLKPLYLSYPTIFGLKQITSQPSQNMPCWAPSVPVKLQQLVQSKVVNKRIIGVKILITTKFNKPKKQSLYICPCRMFEIIFFIIIVHI